MALKPYLQIHLRLLFRQMSRMGYLTLDFQELVGKDQRKNANEDITCEQALRLNVVSLVVSF